MKTYILFDNDIIKFIPFDLHELHKKGKIELCGSLYSVWDIVVNSELTYINDQPVKVYIVKKK